ncbi:zinc-dependent metalloprotease [Panacibacter sp. DH6]|uniref:Zinc-dependent metalloprotease n=1 Tax=Panacibacter microcysteis TaxID=2793269 RepID=A0A931H0E1_9BACT|nr:zinc-dependent metalloprotease [Panacibacter microcysteis]MBG9378705.1 zinc-dependent metalloprotease [Panacibacter microcysteis]
MQIRSFALCAVLGSTCFMLQAQVKKPASAKPKIIIDSAAAKRDSIWSSTIKDKKKIGGLFTLYQDTVTGTLQLYIKKDQVGKEFIYQSFSLGGPGSLFLNQNMLRETWVFKIRKTYNRLDFMRCNTNFYYDPGNAVSKAANVDVSDAVFYADKVVAEDSLGYLVNADGLFIGEKLDPVKPNFPPNIPPGVLFNVGSLVPDKSGYEKIRSFPENTDVIVSLAYDNPAPMNYGDKSITDARYVRVKMQHSFIEMPQNDYKPRFDDPRIGFFTQEQDDMTSTKATPYHDLINRWNLVKKDPNAAISEPVKPIVWWVENTTPVELRQVILDAGNKWNLAFEKAGFKNAVVMKLMPDTATWDPADIRYNVIRWVSSDLGYAIGPSFVNPRTGEILGSDITIDYGFMGGIDREQDLFKPTGFPALSRKEMLPANVRNHFMGCDMLKGLQMQYGAGVAMVECFDTAPEELVTLKEQFFTELVLHEMGHTMGLNHNMKSSQMLSPAELNDKSITRKYGVTGSVMDYSTVNAALDRSKQGDYYTTVPGPYDDWAIEYGYRQFTPAEENAGLQKILSRSTEPKLIFGNDADIAFPGGGIDPRVTTWDMSNDMVTYSANRFQLVNELMGKVKDKYAVPGASYASMRRSYNMLFGQRYSMALPLAMYVGGVYVDRSFVGQDASAVPFTPVPADYQKKAMEVLNTYVFAPAAFDADTYLIPYLQMQRRGYNFFGNPEDPKPDKNVFFLQTAVLEEILDASTLARANRTTLYGNTYAPANILNDLTANIFDADLKGDVNLYRQNLQTAYVTMLAKIINKGDDYDDASKAAALGAIKNVKDKLAKAAAGNEQTKAHRANLQFLIDKALVIK